MLFPWTSHPFREKNSSAWSSSHWTISIKRYYDEKQSLSKRKRERDYIEWIQATTISDTNHAGTNHKDTYTEASPVACRQ